MAMRGSLADAARLAHVREAYEREIVATGKVVHESKRLFLAEATVETGGRVIGRGNGSFMRSAIRLEPSIGYDASIT